MHLLEAIIDANHRALAGDAKAGIHPADFRESLPLVALTCIDPRLNRFFPGVLGLPEEEFIWLRNAGNILTGPLSSTMRSLALACAVKRGREIAIIGHSDCRIRQTSVSSLVDHFKALGIERSQLPENLTEFFGMFASEQQNVIHAVDLARSSPLIGPKIPVHGLLVDVGSGKLDWVVNGYETLDRSVTHAPPGVKTEPLGKDFSDLAASIGNFNIGEMKFPEGKIGSVVNDLKERIEAAESIVGSAQKVLKKPSIHAPESPAPPIVQPPMPPRIALRKNVKWK